MKKITLENNLNVFGIEVKTFPEGIGEAFDELIKQTGDSAGKRNYYGISSINKDGKIMYKAVAEEKYEGEANDLKYEKELIEKGEYLYSTLYHWQNKTSCIKDIFGEMMQNQQADNMKPCVEWYKNAEEMLCMMKTK